MIDLHLHLDGSLAPEQIIYLAKKQGIALPAYSVQKLLPYLVADKAADLNEYLAKFKIPLLVLQSADAVESAVYLLIERLEKLGVVYAEIRFAPQLHTERGLTQHDVVAAACRGLGAATADFTTKAKLILCCMRFKNNINENMETVYLAKEFAERGVCAVDLAGAEAVYKTSNFKCVFDKARCLGVPFTIHAGEADGADSIKSAVEFGAKRIGHGVRLAEDKQLMQYVLDNKIPLEMCPTSNFQTGAVKSVKEHPVLRYLEAGIPVTVNSDNMTVSDTNMIREFNLLKKQLGMTEIQKKKLLQNAAGAAFLTEVEKNKIISKIKNEGVTAL